MLGVPRIRVWHVSKPGFRFLADGKAVSKGWWVIRAVDSRLVVLLLVPVQAIGACLLPTGSSIGNLHFDRRINTATPTGIQEKVRIHFDR